MLNRSEGWVMKCRTKVNDLVENMEMLNDYTYNKR